MTAIMLANTVADCELQRKFTRFDFDHGIHIPTVDADSVRIIEGRAVISARHVSAHEKLLQSLRGADRLTLRKLFHTLSPPAMDSLAGEFDAELLNQGGPILNLLTERLFAMHGNWMGKAFKPVCENTGVGYNYFESGGKAVHKLLMTTAIEKSTLDEGMSLKISYKTKNRGPISWLFGEVRQVTPNVMLGTGIFGPAVGSRDVSRRKIPFLLVGPCRSYQYLAPQG